MNEASAGTARGPPSVAAPERVVYRHRWDPPAGTTPRERGVYLLHGMGAHTARYERLTARLAGDGWRVAAHDQPGHGRSDGRRGVLEQADEPVDRAGVELAAFADRTGAARSCSPTGSAPSSRPSS